MPRRSASATAVDFLMYSEKIPNNTRKIGSKIKILNAYKTFKFCIGRIAKIMNIVKTHRLYLYIEIENKEINKKMSKDLFETMKKDKKCKIF